MLCCSSLLCRSVVIINFEIWFWFVICSSLFRNDATISEQVIGDKFIVKKISNGMTYYQALFPRAEDQTLCPAKDSQTSSALLSDSSSTQTHTSSPLLSDTSSHTPTSSHSQSDSVTTSRPLLIFFSWLSAQPGAVAKYRDLYLDQGMDVLHVQSSVMHFLWPCWGLNYGLEVLKVLEEPRFSERQVLIHASSIGGYTFTQMLTHIAQGPQKHAGLAQRVIGHIYDSLVVGTLEHMAIGQWMICTTCSGYFCVGDVYVRSLNNS